jgi:UDP-3-O-[3-hydroxymyristoyl] glucosamine N-acyltransferase
MRYGNRDILSHMQFTATQIAHLLQGTVEGDANATVSKLSKIEEGGEGSLSFLANPAYAQYVYNTTASVVIIGQDFALTAPVKTTLGARGRCARGFRQSVGDVQHDQAGQEGNITTSGDRRKCNAR